MRVDWGEAPPRGTFSVTVRRAEYEAEYVGEGKPSTYCVLWVLEPTRRRRRRTAVARHAMSAEWQQTFHLDDTSADATAVVDVWRERDGGSDEYFGKVTLPVAELRPPSAAWHELVQGRIELSASFERDVSPDQSAPPEGGVLGAGSAGRARGEQAAHSAQARRAVRSDEDDSSEDGFEAERAADRAQPAGARAQGGGDGGGDSGGGGLEYFEFTHRGGDGTGPKENQDAYFTVRLGARDYVWGVLDGHGHDNGKVAAEAARDSFSAFFEAREHFAALRTRPQATMEEAFSRANAAVRAAILARPGVSEKEGNLVMAMEVDEACPLGYDVVDGGTTATLAALLDGRTLVVAAVGDSCGVLATCARGRVRARELVPEHSALNKAEFELIGKGGCSFVYEYPDMFERGHLPVWETGAKVRTAGGAVPARPRPVPCAALLEPAPTRLIDARPLRCLCARRARLCSARARSGWSTSTGSASRRRGATAPPRCSHPRSAALPAHLQSFGALLAAPPDAVARTQPAPHRPLRASGRELLADVARSHALARRLLPPALRRAAHARGARARPEGGAARGPGGRRLCAAPRVGRRVGPLDVRGGDGHAGRPAHGPHGPRARRGHDGGDARQGRGGLRLDCGQSHVDRRCAAARLTFVAVVFVVYFLLSISQEKDTLTRATRSYWLSDHDITTV